MEKSPEFLESVLKEHPEWKSSRVAEYTGYSRRQVRRKRKELYDAVDSVVEVGEEDVYIENAKLRRETQALRDKLRVLRKDDRTSHRYQNASEEFAKELTVALDKRSLIIGQYTKEHEIVHGSCTGILQLSDIHFNELIAIANNTYDFRIASKRLKKFVHQATFIFKLYGVETVVIAMTGDMINSDRRLDELLNMATNRARATILATHILSQVIVDLNSTFNVEVAYVSGNESRMAEHVAYSDILISDNYDTMIFELLKREFRHADGIKFLPSNIIETIISVQGHNILLMHGEQIGDTGIDKKIQQIKGRFSFPISYIIYGHLHDARVGDLYARSSSMCGPNAYSQHGLQLEGRSSQLIHLVTESSIDCMKIDLQHTNGWSGYDIENELVGYNVKSADKVSWFTEKTI